MGRPRSRYICSSRRRWVSSNLHPEIAGWKPALCRDAGLRHSTFADLGTDGSCSASRGRRASRSFHSLAVPGRLILLEQSDLMKVCLNHVAQTLQVPCLADGDARLALDPKDAFRVQVLAKHA